MDIHDIINTLHRINNLQEYLTLYELLSRYPKYYQPVSFRSIAKDILKITTFVFAGCILLSAIV